MSEVDWDAVRDQVAASIRAEVIILSCTPGTTSEMIISAVIRDATLWVDRGLRAARDLDRCFGCGDTECGGGCIPR